MASSSAPGSHDLGRAAASSAVGVSELTVTRLILGSRLNPAGHPGWGGLFFAAEKSAQDGAEHTALVVAEHTVHDAAQRIVVAAEDAAEHLTESAGGLRRGFGLAAELLADVGQNDRCEDRQQFLHQV